MLRTIQRYWYGISVEDFISAAGDGSSDIVQQYIIENINNPNAVNAISNSLYHRTALITAAAKGKSDVVDQLLAVPGININIADSFGETALSMATRFGQTRIVKTLLNIPGIHLNTTDRYWNHSPLMNAAEYGDTEIIKALLAAPDININIADNHDNTALFLAIYNHKDAAIKALLGAANINLNTVDRKGNTALHLTVKYIRPEAVKLLLAIPDININAVNQKGNTPLMIAAQFGFLTITDLLAHPDIDINTANHNGDTALILAARNGYITIVELLLNANADTSIINNDGKTAEMVTEKDKIRIMIRNSSLEEKLKEFQQRRVKMASTQLYRAANISLQAATDDLDFILSNMDKLEDFTLLPELIVRFSNLLFSLGEKDKDLSQYGHVLMKLAASKGHQVAKHIVENYRDEIEQEDTSKETKKRSREADLKLFGRKNKQTANTSSDVKKLNRRVD